MKMSNPTITFLIGPPAAGKSTWTAKYGKGSIIISRDDIVDKLRGNMSYNDTFLDRGFQKKVNSVLASHISKSIKSGKDIVVDMTNMSVKSRSNILSRIGDEYHRKAVVFKVDKPELVRRLKQREMETGKHIPMKVLDSMISRYEPPTYDEFDEIEIYK
jgi:predicted kinase